MRERSKTKAGLIQLLAMLMIMVMVSGCFNNENNSPPSSDPGEAGNPGVQEPPFTSEPITVTLFSNSAGINTDYDLEELFIKPVREKYPNITVEQIRGVSLDQLILAGEIPDLIPTTYGRIGDLIDLGLTSDLTEMTKRLNIDLDQFEPEVVNAVKLYGQNGEFLAMPYAMNYGVLLYNKDVFDKFGVDYPGGKLTWPEVYDLARLLTRMDGEMQYIGYNSAIQDYTLARSLSGVDSQDRSILTTEPFQQIFQMVRSLYDIPSIVEPDGRHLYGGINSFIVDQKVVMYPFWIAGLTSRVQALEGTPNDFNWDLAPFPSFPDNPDVGRQVEFQSIVVPPTGRNIEAAFRVIEAVTSLEAQKQINRTHSITVLADPALKQESFSELTVYNDKNIQSIFTVSPAPRTLPSPYDAQINSILNAAVARMVVDNLDVNSALREADEKLEQHIREVKAR